MIAQTIYGMTRYDYIISLGDNTLKLIAKSLVPLHILDWKVYYEAYLNELDLQKKNTGKVKKEDAVLNVTATYDIGRRQLYNIIKFWESE